MTDLMAKKKYARIQEVKNLKEPNENCIRVYCVQWPDVFNFQIRTHGPIQASYNKQGKPRDMIATVSLTLTEMEQILAYMKQEAGEAGRGKSKRINVKGLELI